MHPTLKLWIGGAISAFIDGFIDGFPVGAPAGGGIALADGQAFADLGRRHLAIEAAHILSIPIFTGLADVRAYRKASPFPNIFSTVQPANPPTPSPSP